ncbi:MAG: ATP-dependent Clp protease proteolytic subunit [Verrucomicrobiota bacterium]
MKNVWIVCLVALGIIGTVYAQESDLPPITVKGTIPQAEPSKAVDIEAGSVVEKPDAPKVAKEDEDAAEKKEEAKDPEDEALKAMDKEIARLRKERDLISTQNLLRAEQMKAELAESREERERLQTEASLLKERLSAALLQSKLELDRMGSEVDRINKEMLLERTKNSQSMAAELAEFRNAEERLKAEVAVKEKEMTVELAALRLADTKLKLRRAELEMEVVELQAKLARKDVGDMVDDRIYEVSDKMYLKEPYVDGTLHISDRRIAMNGIVWSGMATHISERINYFNNESTEFPIFIVIDSSPGGSVMSGYKILKAMEGSEAPVYVVVKSYAASMAAAVTALAEKSYAFPNAILLHHQISWGMLGGNLTQQKEYISQMEEWWQRLAKPISEKMGLTIEEFTSLMYENDSDGDWMEFADKAVEYKWIDRVVDKIWEMSIDRNPDRYGMQTMASAPLEEVIDENGEAYVRLPRLDPYDVYFLHSPDGYYRMK